MTITVRRSQLLTRRRQKLIAAYIERHDEFFHGRRSLFVTWSDEERAAFREWEKNFGHYEPKKTRKVVKHSGRVQAQASHVDDDHAAVDA